MLLLLSADFFKINFFQKNYSGTLSIRVSNSLDQNQDRHFVGPDLGPSCLLRSSADDKSRHQQGKSKGVNLQQTTFSNLAVSAGNQICLGMSCELSASRWFTPNVKHYFLQISQNFHLLKS